MNTASSFYIGMRDREVSLTTPKQNMTSINIDSKLINYQTTRCDLWDIHLFVAQVIASDKFGFNITIDKKGNKRIRPLALAWHFPLIRTYIAQIPEATQPGRYIGLFLECVIELQLNQDGFTKPELPHRPGMNGGELFNTFLDLIRKKAKTIQRYIKAVAYVSDYDERIFNRLKEYLERLFMIYSKILVVRLDLEYQSDFAPFVTLFQAQKDIGDFINRRRLWPLFQHCVGFVVAREKGGNGCGYHFHAMLFFDGQKQRGDVYLGERIGEDYWVGYITRINGQGDTLLSRGRYFNCNTVEYDHNGIGMVCHSDEVKRAELLYALLYMTKNSQDIGREAPPKTKTITRGVMPRIDGIKLGRPRKTGRLGNEQSNTGKDSPLAIDG